jgi:hypothetical protein
MRPDLLLQVTFLTALEEKLLFISAADRLLNKIGARTGGIGSQNAEVCIS